MKRVLPYVCVVCLVSILLMGSSPVGAPIVHTKGFYVNDYASMLFNLHRDDIMALSIDLYSQTGAQVVVVAVEDLGGTSIQEYGERLISGWRIGGEDGSDGILLLISGSEKESRVFVGKNLTELKKHETDQVEIGDANNISRAIMDVYRPIIRDCYKTFGATPPEELEERLNREAETNGGPINAATFIIVGVMALAVGRSYRNSRKYKGKYLRGNVRKHKSYTRQYDEEKEYSNDKIYGVEEDR